MDREEVAEGRRKRRSDGGEIGWRERKTEGGSLGMKGEKGWDAREVHIDREDRGDGRGRE